MARLEHTGRLAAELESLYTLVLAPKAKADCMFSRHVSLSHHPTRHEKCKIMFVLSLNHEERAQAQTVRKAHKTGVSRRITNPYCTNMFLRGTPSKFSGCFGLCYRSINAKLGASILRRAPDVKNAAWAFTAFTFEENACA